MGGIADAEKARAGPVAEAIDGDGEEFDVAPIFQLRSAALEKGSDGFKVTAKGGQAFSLESSKRALGNHVGALPIVFAIESDEDFSVAKTAERLCGIAGLARNAHPEDVDGSAEIDDFEAGLFADDGVAAIGTDG